MPPLVSRVIVPVAILLASVLLHLGLLGMIVLAGRHGPTTQEIPAIEVELVSAPETPEPPKPELPKPEPLKPEPPKPELPKPEAPKPEASKAEPPKPAEPEAKAEAKPEAQPEPQQVPPPEMAAAPQDQPQVPEPPAKPVGPSGGPASDSKAKLTPEELAAFRAQVQKCWTLPVGLPDAMRLEAVLRVSLARNGAITAGPELLRANASAGGPVLVGIAMKALRECGPYRSLPAAKYNEWKVLDLRFLATGMAGLGSARPPKT